MFVGSAVMPEGERGLEACMVVRPNGKCGMW